MFVPWARPIGPVSNHVYQFLSKAERIYCKVKQKKQINRKIGLFIAVLSSCLMLEFCFNFSVNNRDTTPIMVSRFRIDYYWPFHWSEPSIYRLLEGPKTKNLILIRQIGTPILVIRTRSRIYWLSASLELVKNSGGKVNSNDSNVMVRFSKSLTEKAGKIYGLISYFIYGKSFNKSYAGENFQERYRLFRIFCQLSADKVEMFRKFEPLAPH